MGVDEGCGSDAADYLDCGYVCFVVVGSRFIGRGRGTEHDQRLSLDPMNAGGAECWGIATSIIDLRRSHRLANRRNRMQSLLAIQNWSSRSFVVSGSSRSYIVRSYCS